MQINRDLMTRLLLTLGLLYLWQSVHGAAAQYTCREEFEVLGASSSSARRGVFTSENYPHALPVQSSCTYEFRAYSLGPSTAFCIRFEELDLFTLSAVPETRIELRVESQANPGTVYSGNGSLIKELESGLRPANTAVVTRPRHLLDGPLCFGMLYYKNTYTLSVKNYLFVIPHIEKPRRFLARYYIVDTAGLDKVEETMPNLGKGGLELHRCLDGAYINKSKCCNGRKDCNLTGAGSSDFFDQVSSDESYEHARCFKDFGFGTNFAKAESGAHIRISKQVKMDCTSSGDHSRFYSSVYDTRDCGMALPRPSVSNGFAIRLYSIRRSAVLGPVCYRLYWRSSLFDSPAESLTFSSGFRALLRLSGRWKSNNWHMIEMEIDHRQVVMAPYIDVFTLRPFDLDVIPSKAGHWIDDLSAEPAACNASTYETRMPAVCSFEWSSCGWDTDLPIVSSSSISDTYLVAFRDHTSELLSGFGPQFPTQQYVLQLQGNASGQLESKRRLPYGDSFCFGLWFYGLGASGYSVRLDVQVDLKVSSETTTFQLTATAPNNKWRLLMAELSPRTPGIPNLSVRVEARQHSELREALLDDVSIYSGGCSGYESNSNGTVNCGTSEWKCDNRVQCISITRRCNRVGDCEDHSDERGCSDQEGTDDDKWMTSMRVIIGVTVVLCTLSIVYIIIRSKYRRRQRGSSARRSETPRTVTNGRLPDPPISSDRMLGGRMSRDRPPSYRLVARTLGAINAGFATDDSEVPPPKYEDAVAAVAAAGAEEGADGRAG